MNLIMCSALALIVAPFGVRPTIPQPLLAACSKPFSRQTLAKRCQRLAAEKCCFTLSLINFKLQVAATCLLPCVIPIGLHLRRARFGLVHPDDEPER